MSDHLNRCTVPHVVDIGLVRQSETGNPWVWHGFARFQNLFSHPFRFEIVYKARAVNQRRFLRRRTDDKPGIHRDTMTTDARSGPEYIDSRVHVGETNEFAY